MTPEETRTRLRQLEDRLGKHTPPPIEGQTRIPLPHPARADDEGEGPEGRAQRSEGRGARSHGAG